MPLFLPFVMVVREEDRGGGMAERDCRVSRRRQRKVVTLIGETIDRVGDETLYYFYFYSVRVEGDDILRDSMILSRAIILIAN